MTILFTTQFGEIAGSTYSLLFLALGLKEKGHEVFIAAPRKSLILRLAEGLKIKYYPIPFRFKIDPFSIFKIGLIVRKNEVDIINAQESRDRYNAIWSKLLFRLSAKIILTRRQRVADNNPIKRWIHVRFSEKIVVVSKGLQALMQRKGFPIDHTHIIYNALPKLDFKRDQKEIDRLRAKYGFSDDEVVIGCVARPKRQDLLIRALRELPEGWKLLLVGITAKELQDKFTKLDYDDLIERIRFTGLIENKSEVFHHYLLMKVNILPSQMDGFGLVLVEAMAMGIPVMGSNYGGIPDVIEHGKSGFIFENDNIPQLSNYIREIVQNEQLRKSFIQRGRQIATEKFTISKTVNEYERLFIKTIQ